jgi:hypothetical protein
MDWDRCRGAVPSGVERREGWTKPSTGEDGDGMREDEGPERVGRGCDAGTRRGRNMRGFWREIQAKGEMAGSLTGAGWGRGWKEGAVGGDNHGGSVGRMLGASLVMPSGEGGGGMAAQDAHTAFLNSSREALVSTDVPCHFYKKTPCISLLSTRHPITPLAIENRSRWRSACAALIPHRCVADILIQKKSLAWLLVCGPSPPSPSPMR